MVEQNERREKPVAAESLMLREAWRCEHARKPSAAALKTSSERLAVRQQIVAKLELPDELPITARAEEIGKAMLDHQVIVISGETGSGKTTQLPKIALAMGFGRRGMIGHTQPRRLAARSVAARIAEETELVLGESLGFQVRFDDRSSPNTLVKLMTDGILLNELQHDKLLLDYEMLIIDEAHERSLNIDFLIGYLATILKRRPSLRVVITSATIDHQRFAEHFGDAPVIEVSGRGYPVEVEYREGAGKSDDSRAIANRVCDAVADLQRRSLAKGAGDVLVFLPGEREIRDAERALTKRGLVGGRGWEALPLYGRLSDKDQSRVFKPQAARRVVLATNVAETSLTVPRIGAVVDSGLARLSRYSHRSRIQRLALEPISQASANQRAGRCGRIGPGICVRLYDALDFEQRPAFTDAEIMRTNLASVVLQMASLGLGDIDAFPFLDCPEPAQIEDAYRLLLELGAIDEYNDITRAGRKLARLPLDPRLGRMLLESGDEQASNALLIIVAGLSIQDPRQRPPEQTAAADSAHAKFADTTSDFITFFDMWRGAAEQRTQLTSRKFDLWCESVFLSPRRMREWREVAGQLARLLKQKLDIKQVPQPLAKATRERVHRAISTGLYAHIGHREENNQYEGARQRQFNLHPSTGLRGKLPTWVMALEIVHTTRRYARYVAALDTDWVLQSAGDLLDHEHDQPYWNARRGRVEAKRTTLIFGLILRADERVDFSDVDREQARAVFLREGLAQDKVELKAAFIAHNRAQRTQIAQMEGQLRRAVEVSAQRIADLFDAVLPPSVCDRASLKRWLAKHPRNDKALQFSAQDFLSESASADIEGMPKQASVGGNQLGLIYRFAPNDSDDGASLRVPQALLGALKSADVDDSVPAFLRRRIEIRLRALPKPLRKRLQPLAERAESIRLQMQDEGDVRGSFSTRLASVLLREFAVQVPDGAWEGIDEPDYLRPRIVVVGPTGKVLATSRDLARLQADSKVSRDEQIESTGDAVVARDWQFSELPLEQNSVQGSVRIKRYPALRVDGSGVARHDFLDPREAQNAHEKAVLTLLRFGLPQQVKSLRKMVLEWREIQLLWLSQNDPSAEILIEDFVQAAFRRTFGAGHWGVRDASAFASLLEQQRALLMSGANQLRDSLLAILKNLHSLRECISDAPSLHAAAVADIEQQAAALVYPGFMAAAPANRVDDIARYLAAATLRLQAIASNPARDCESMAMIHSLQARVEALAPTQSGGERTRAAQAFRWQIEELRVSLFAQTLGTRDKVSMKRLEKRWDEILRMQD